MEGAAEVNNTVNGNGKINLLIDYLALTRHLVELDETVTQRKLNMTNEGRKLTLFDDIMLYEEREESSRASKNIKCEPTLWCNFCSDEIPSGTVADQRCFSCKKVGCDDCLEFGCDYCKWHEGDYSLICDDCGEALNEEKCGQRTCDRCAAMHYKNCECLWEKMILE